MEWKFEPEDITQQKFYKKSKKKFVYGKTVLNYTSFAEYEKSVKMSKTNGEIDNTIERAEIECVMKQIEKLEKLKIIEKM